METKPINVIEVDPELLKQPTGNLAFQSVEDFVKQFFKEGLCVKILGQDELYDESQAIQLIERLKELVNESNGVKVNIKTNVVEVDPELLKQPTGNLAFQSVEDFVKQFFKEELYVKIKTEDVIYHKSQSEQLIERLKELTNESNNNKVNL